MKRFIRTLRTTALCLAVAGLAASPSAFAAEKEKFSLAWSIYVGWMPWAYAEDKGIIDKWADKYGIEIDVVQINDYIESINQYSAGQFDACTMTNMDALTIPAAGGVDSTALIVGDFSNGNDGIILKDKDTLADIEGQQVNLVELSVSHYTLARALETVDLSERDVTVVNTSDADIVGAFGSPDVTSVVTWNPQLSEILGRDDAHLVFDSSQIPGEIIDMTVANSEVIADNPEFAKALTGAWYEVMSIMAADDAAGREARTYMGKAAGTDLAGYDKQVASTRFFFEPAEAVEFVNSPELIETMDLVRQFSFDHGILGEGAASVDYVGMGFPDDKTLGDTGNLNLRFTAEYMKLAADGEL